MGLIGEVDHGAGGTVLEPDVAGDGQCGEVGHGTAAHKQTAGRFRQTAKIAEPVDHHQLEFGGGRTFQPASGEHVEARGQRVGHGGDEVSGAGNEGEEARVIEAAKMRKDVARQPVEHGERVRALLGGRFPQSGLERGALSHAVGGLIPKRVEPREQHVHHAVAEFPHLIRAQLQTAGGQPLTKIRSLKCHGEIGLQQPFWRPGCCRLYTMSTSLPWIWRFYVLGVRRAACRDQGAGERDKTAGSCKVAGLAVQRLSDRDWPVLGASMRIALALLAFAALAGCLATTPRTIKVAQAAPADVVGNDSAALQKAAEMLKPGDTLSIGEGTYEMDNSLFIPTGVTVRGTAGRRS